MDKREEKTLVLATLVFPVRRDEVMLGLKMKKIGIGCLNGWGGGVEKGESILMAAAREFSEESGAGVEVDDLEKIGIVHFTNNKSDGSVFVCTVHVFVTRMWHGEIVSTPEMAIPRWYPIASLRDNKLMPADPFWLPRMLRGEKGIAWAEYAPYQASLIGEVRFEPVGSFEEE